MRPGCKVWALKGQRPLAFHRTRYEWLYVYLFVHPASGRSTFLILPTVNSELMRLALREFQQEVDPEGRKVLRLLHLPPYTPSSPRQSRWCLCCGKRWPMRVSPAWRLCKSVWQSGVSISRSTPRSSGGWRGSGGFLRNDYLSKVGIKPRDSPVHSGRWPADPCVQTKWPRKVCRGYSRPCRPR